MTLALALVVASTLTQQPPNRPFAVEVGGGLGAGGVTYPMQYVGSLGGPALQSGAAAVTEPARPLAFFGRVDATLFVNATGGYFTSGAIHLGVRLNLGPIFFAEAGAGGTSFLLPAYFISTNGRSSSLSGFSGEFGVGARGGDRLQHTCAVRAMGGPVASDVQTSESGFWLGLACSLSWPEPAR